MSSIFGEKIRKIVHSSPEQQKLVEDLVYLLFENKMDKKEIGKYLSLIQSELSNKYKDNRSQKLMSDLKNNLANVIANSIVDRVRPQ
jgi:hypothetical protein